MILLTYIKPFVELVFSAGLILNAGLFIPQAVKIIRNKNAGDLSFITFAGFNVMQVFTAWHAYFAKDYLLMFGFILAFISCAAVTVLIYIYNPKLRS